MAFVDKDVKVGNRNKYIITKSERKESFVKLKQLRKKGTVTDYDVELVSYREDKYGK